MFGSQTQTENIFDYKQYMFIIKKWIIICTAQLYLHGEKNQETKYFYKYIHINIWLDLKTQTENIFDNKQYMFIIKKKIIFCTTQLYLYLSIL